MILEWRCLRQAVENNEDSEQQATLAAAWAAAELASLEAIHGEDGTGSLAQGAELEADLHGSAEMSQLSGGGGAGVKQGTGAFPDNW